MGGYQAWRRCRDRLDRLGEAGLPSEEFRYEAAAELRAAIGFELWCWALADPSSLVPSSGVASSVPAADVARVMPSLVAAGQVEQGPQRGQLVRARRPVRSLAQATRGVLERSRCWSEWIAPVGLGDHVVVACRDAYGCWGWFEAYRAEHDRPFTAEETAFLGEIAASLASALRRHASSPAAAAVRRPPGVFVLDRELRATAWTDVAHAWAQEFPGPMHRSAGLLPSVVYAIAAATTSDGAAANPRQPQARVRTSRGTWAVVEGAALHGDAGDAVAVTIRSAAPAELFDLLCMAHALTRRERQIAALAIEGMTTGELAERIVVSPHTVKDHLSSIFQKTGTSGRHELLARVAWEASRGGDVASSGAA